MRVVLHIGADPVIAHRLLGILAAKRNGLARKGVLVPAALGPVNHDALWQAIGPEGSAAARDAIADAIAEARGPDTHTLVLGAHQLAGQADDAAIARLRAMLDPLAEDVRIIAHFDHPAEMYARRYAAQVFSGRVRPLSDDLALAAAGCRRADLRAAWDAAGAKDGDVLYPEAERAALWLDPAGMVAAWQAAFGAERVHLASVSPDTLWGEDATAILNRDLLPGVSLGKAAPATPPRLPSAAWVARARRFNAVLARWSKVAQTPVPRNVHARLIREFGIGGAPIDPGGLSAITDHVLPALEALAQAHPDLRPDDFAPVAPAAPWQEADRAYGFRATQYLAAFVPRLRRAAKAAAQADPAPEAADAALGPTARRLMPPAAKRKFLTLARSVYAPHDALPPPQDATPAFPDTPAQGTGRAIVACAKNEGPYLVEWVAHHRAIGFDRILVYTNDCDDGTDAILRRMADLGLVTHRDNSAWRGRSPQQHALDAALREPQITGADWVAHIDIDEFVNIQTGDGTLDALLAAVPEATHVAMTWRLFGSAGIRAFADAPVTEQFTRAAPRYLPKPHIAWGFKTLGRTLGAYRKLACHRPAGLRPEAAHRVHWVNGSGRPMPHSLRQRGWRNGRETIGYDLVQLNHYATRALEAFLIKRQRGRALHVDRTIGLNYWLRMDWNDHTDRSILRHRPRTARAAAAMMADATLARLHAEAVAWHRARVRALRADPAFAALYAQAAELTLSATERAAWALALDMES